MKIEEKHNYKIGDDFEIPTERGCSHIGKIVGISEGKKKIYVQCPKSHSTDPLTGESYGTETFFSGGKKRKKRIRKRNIVYIIGIS